MPEENEPQELTSLFLIQTADADPEDVDHVFANRHSEWKWLRLPNGDLVLGVYPQGDTYFDVADRAGV